MSTKVFGIGLNKTGTKTLRACLRQLGYDHLSYRVDLLHKYLDGHVNEVLGEIDGYESFDDWPYPIMYRDLFERYGLSAKFVLTRRTSPKVWLDSLKRHSLRTDPRRHARLLTYSFAYPFGAERRYVDTYVQHLAEVRAFFEAHGAQDSLCEFCWEDGDSWPELCGFLGVKPPAVPFPHANEGRELRIDDAVIDANIAGVRQQLGLLNPHLDAEALALVVKSALEGFVEVSRLGP